jgi:hypothetical protein
LREEKMQSTILNAVQKYNDSKDEDMKRLSADLKEKDDMCRAFEARSLALEAENQQLKDNIARIRSVVTGEECLTGNTTSGNPIKRGPGLSKASRVISAVTKPSHRELRANALPYESKKRGRNTNIEDWISETTSEPAVNTGDIQPFSTMQLESIQNDDEKIGLSLLSRAIESGEHHPLGSLTKLPVIGGRPTTYRALVSGSIKSGNIVSMDSLACMDDIRNMFTSWKYFSEEKYTAGLTALLSGKRIRKHCVQRTLGTNIGWNTILPKNQRIQVAEEECDQDFACLDCTLNGRPCLAADQTSSFSFGFIMRPIHPSFRGTDHKDSLKYWVQTDKDIQKQWREWHKVTL